MANTPKYHGTPIIEDKHGKILRPITRGQQDLLEAMESNDIVFVNGPAGTGKTVIATWYGIAGIDAGLYDQLVLTRPIVEAGEELGFLPGTFEEKVAPYMQPLYEAIEVVKGKRITTEMDTKIGATQHQNSYRDKKGMLKKKPTNDAPSKKAQNEDFYKRVNVCPLAYLRGSTKSKSFIILDEAQNVTTTQMKLMLTRLGQGSKLIVCGDINQSDLERSSMSGFREAQKLLQKVDRIGFVHLDINDIVRHKLIRDIIIRYESKQAKRNSDVYSNRFDNEHDNENFRDLRNFDCDLDEDADGDEDVDENGEPYEESDPNYDEDNVETK
jgi:phosphate starvation-inducible protein PhoH and related proteins